MTHAAQRSFELPHCNLRFLLLHDLDSNKTCIAAEMVLHMTSFQVHPRTHEFLPICNVECSHFAYYKTRHVVSVLFQQDLQSEGTPLSPLGHPKDNWRLLHSCVGQLEEVQRRLAESHAQAQTMQEVLEERLVARNHAAAREEQVLRDNLAASER